MPRQPAECGTRGGYYRHRHNKQDACGDCKAAHAAYNKAANAARQRAWQRLARRYSEAYKQLLSEEKAKEDRS